MSLILGVVEGLTGRLPVSSTAHLRATAPLLCKPLLGLTADQPLHDPFWKMFSIVIQLGAILCLPIYFRRRIAEFLATFPRGCQGVRTVLNHPLTLTFLAFLCTAIPAFLLKKVIGKNLESVALMGAALLVGGGVMWVVDAIYGNRQRSGDVESIGFNQALWIGLCQ